MVKHNNCSIDCRKAKGFVSLLRIIQMLKCSTSHFTLPTYCVKMPSHISTGSNAGLRNLDLSNMVSNNMSRHLLHHDLLLACIYWSQPTEVMKEIRVKKIQIREDCAFSVCFGMCRTSPYFKEPFASLYSINYLCSEERKKNLQDLSTFC